MQHDFWQRKWDEQKIGFNQNRPNALLIEHFKDLNVAKGNRVFVPLAGKSIDMVWLAEQGYNVVAVELVESAVQQFFTEQNMDVTITKHANNDLILYKGTHAGQTLELWAGDIFDLSIDDVGNIAGIYDRAALVALPDEDAEDSLRKRYVKKVCELTSTAPQLLLNFVVNEDVLDESRSFDRKTFGPPFVVEDDAIYDYFKDVYDLQIIGKEEPNNKDVLVNQAWLLTPKI